MKFSAKKYGVVCITAAFTAVIFILDLSLPLGVAGGALYVAPVLVASMARNNQSFILKVAVAASILILLGYYYSPSGGVAWVVFTNRLLSLAVIWVTATIVFRRNKATVDLLNSEARYRNLIEDSILPIQIVNIDGQWIYANRSCVDLFGFASLDDLLAVPRLGLVADHDKERVEKHRTSFFEGRTSETDYEYDGMRADGSVIPLQAFMRNIEWDGQQVLSRIFVDLSEKKKSEAQLRQSQKMEAIGQLTGGVAHDFNNLLAVVIGNLDMLYDRLDEGELRNFVEQSINSAMSGAELTQQLLSYSRTQTLTPHPIDLNEPIEGMIDVLRRTLGKSVDVELKRSGEPWHCDVDKGQLETAILNLSLNARDAMPEGGRLTFEITNCHFHANIDAVPDEVLFGDYLQLVVSDTGTGMPREVIDSAFDPFFTTKDVGEGSGLGLSMVYGFVKQSGGQVVIDSEQGVGTSVNIYFPRSATVIKPAEQQQSVTAKSVPKGETILVVEDDPKVRVVTANILGQLGYSVTVANDGEDALELLQRTTEFDLLFTDIMLPGAMNGVDVATEVSRRIPNIRVLYTSGYSDNILAQLDQFDRSGLFIRKPYRKDELALRVRNALEQTPYSDHADRDMEMGPVIQLQNHRPAR